MSVIYFSFLFFYSFLKSCPSHPVPLFTFASFILRWNGKNEKEKGEKETIHTHTERRWRGEWRRGSGVVRSNPMRKRKKKKKKKEAEKRRKENVGETTSRCLIEFVRARQRWCNPRQYKFNDNSIISLFLCVLVEKRKYRQRFITTRYKLPAAPPHDLIRSDVSFIAVIPTPSDSIRKMSIKRKKKKRNEIRTRF